MEIIEIIVCIVALLIGVAFMFTGISFIFDREIGEQEAGFVYFVIGQASLIPALHLIF